MKNTKLPEADNQLEFKLYENHFYRADREELDKIIDMA
jgi:hypothetical protein